MTNSDSHRAWSDLSAIVTNSFVWRALAWADIRSKYRFSTFGTFWITLSMGVSAVSIGLIYGQFFGLELRVYLPYFTAGMIIWTFIASAISEATQTLIGASAWIKGASLPISFHIMRMLQRNFIVMLHNMVILGLLWLYFRWELKPEALLSLVGLGITYIFLIGASMIIAYACVRFRDIPPAVQALMQFVFFASPIIWQPEQLKFGQFLLQWNPIVYLLAVTRDPLIGRPVGPADFAIALLLALASLAVGALVYRRYRGRVAYWV
jgi:ABC-type polysaccharide/polyol phosphate export permease